jgi:hypothetical protein
MWHYVRMFILLRFRIVFSSEQDVARVAPQKLRDATRKLINRLSDDFIPIMSSAIKRQAELLGIDFKEILYTAFDPRGRSSGPAELFTDGETLFWVRVPSAPNPRMAGVWVEFLTREPEPPTVTKVQSIVRELFDVDLAPNPMQSRIFQELVAEGRTPPTKPSTRELKAVEALRDKGNRQMALAIKSAGGLLVTDLRRQLQKADQGRSDEIRNSLEKEGLIDNEFVVMCSHTKEQVMRIPSHKVLEEVRRLNARCGCGKPMADEIVEEAVAVLPPCFELLEGSGWMTVLITDELQKAGIPLDSILVEEQVGADEMDVIAQVGGDVILFELKDREFNLRDAYSFAAKVNLIQADLAVIVTTDKVGNDVRDHFKRAESASQRRQHFAEDYSAASSIRYIEGLADLGQQIKSIVGEISMAQAVVLVRSVLPLASIGPVELMENWGKRDLSEGAIVPPEPRQPQKRR